MKAIIMAGGKGTRLQPLTCNIPKPMVPLLDRPCMEYMIELLKGHGITEIGVTLQYLPDVVKNYFGDGSRLGVELKYFEETQPLGTAGSVKETEDFLEDGTFIVVSGDLLTDFNLQEAVNFHKEKGAVATLSTVCVENPCDFGVVLTDESGRVVRFLEKPRWSDVFSNKVNTGIYILEKRLLSGLRRGIAYDFSKDLFPFLMESGQPLFAYQAEGYWSDIGSLAQYRQAQFDMLDGKVDVRIKGRQIAPGVWAGNKALPL